MGKYVQMSQLYLEHLNGLGNPIVVINILEMYCGASIMNACMTCYIVWFMLVGKWQTSP